MFQSRYRQSLFTGNPDAETAAILEVLTAPLLPQPVAPEQVLTTDTSID